MTYIFGLIAVLPLLIGFVYSVYKIFEAAADCYGWAFVLKDIGLGILASAWIFGFLALAIYTA